LYLTLRNSFFLALCIFNMTEELAIHKFEEFIKANVRFDRDAFDMALPNMEIVSLNKGDFFIEKDKTCRHFAYVAEGIIRAFDLNDGNEITTCLCSDNSFATSTLSFITQTPSNISIQAMTKTTLLTLSYENLNALYKKSDFWLQVGKVIMEREFITLQQELWRNTVMGPDEKYLTLLHENPAIIRQIPLRYIASYLHITPETLSRIRKRTSRSIS
jgi:CRP-like cAMP-binding protein